MSSPFRQGTVLNVSGHSIQRIGTCRGASRIVLFRLGCPTGERSFGCYPGTVANELPRLRDRG